MMNMKILKAVVLFVSAAFSAHADLPTLFVAPFSGDSGIAMWQPAMGEGLSEMFTTELGKINKFQMLEINQINDLKNEIGMGQDGWVDATQKVDKGGFAAADFMFTAKVTKFGSKTTSIGLGGFVPGSLGNLGVKQTTSDLRIDWRIVDAATRKIIKTGSAAESEKGLGFSVGANVNGSGGGISLDNKEFMDSALGKATVKALNDIIADIQNITVPASGRSQQKEALAAKQGAEASVAHHVAGKVLAVAGKDVVIISVGSQQGFKEGEKLDLFQTTDVTDDKGAVVYTDEKLVGEVVISGVQPDKSRATYSGDLTVKQGWIVKPK